MHQVCILSVRSQPTATTSETVSEFEYRATRLVLPRWWLTPGTRWTESHARAPLLRHVPSTRSGRAQRPCRRPDNVQHAYEPLRGLLPRLDPGISRSLRHVDDLAGQDGQSQVDRKRWRSRGPTFWRLELGRFVSCLKLVSRDGINTTLAGHLSSPTAIGLSSALVSASSGKPRMRLGHRERRGSPWKGSC